MGDLLTQNLLQQIISTDKGGASDRSTKPQISFKSVTGALTAWSLPARSLRTTIVAGAGASEIKIFPVSSASGYGIKILEGTPYEFSPLAVIDLSTAAITALPGNSGVTCCAWTWAVGA
jgi:hypothetical protein